MSPRSALLIGFGLLIILAGCMAGPLGESPSQEQPINIGLINSANVTHTFNVSVVEGPVRNITLNRNNSQSDYILPRGGLSTSILNEENPPVTSINATNPVQHSQSIKLNSNETHNKTIRDLPSEPAIIVSVENDQRIFSVVTVNCSGNLVYFEVNSHNTYTSSAYNCS